MSLTVSPVLIITSFRESIGYTIGDRDESISTQKLVHNYITETMCPNYVDTGTLRSEPKTPSDLLRGV